MTFTDTAGRDWLVSLNIATVKRVRDMLDVDLLSGDQQVFATLATDPVMLCDVIYVVCKPQADDRGISDEQFGQAMSGDSLGNATDALLGALADFSPSLQKRALMRQMMAKVEAVESRLLDEAKTQLEDGTLDKLIDEAIAKMSAPGNMSPSSPLSPASETPDL